MATDGKEERGSALGSELLTLKQFEVGREIGKGQFSVVHRATFKTHQRPVALKRVQFLEMVDSKARTDCMKEIQLLKVNITINQYIAHKYIYCQLI